MEKLFHLKENGTTVRTEIVAGLTTFFAMAYIIVVNPGILSMGQSNIFNGVVFATCISAAIGTLLMAFLANVPFAQAPGMGLNAFFAFTVTAALGKMTGVTDPVGQYQMGLALILISGILFIVITLLGVRQAIIVAIPKNIKTAISGGIGLFIAFLGLQNAGIVVNSDATLVDLTTFSNWETSRVAVVAIIGVVIIAVLSALNVKGAILIGIVASTLVAYLTGAAVLPAEGIQFGFATQVSDWVSTSLFKMDFATIFGGGSFFGNLMTVIVLVLSFSMVDMFDSIGTFLGTAGQAGLLDENGDMPKMKQALLADAIATACGACLGTSTVTTFVESSAGIGEGGKTGLTALTTGICFILALFFAPVVGLIPGCATAPALIYVGFLMIGGITKMDFSDPTEALPGFLTIAMMPLSYSIANGIAFGLISYVLIKLFTGRFKDIKIGTVVIALLFCIKFFVAI
ncbi:MAG: NCS2 family permease [Oscillospiraceae bacterium]